MIVAGGGTSSTAQPQNWLESTEFLVSGEAAWTEIDSLKLPTFLRGPFMINIKNDVLLTGERNNCVPFNFKVKLKLRW